MSAGNDLLKHMHDAAGKYHIHFSTVRATTTSLLVPIGIIASISLLLGCEKTGKVMPVFFVLFVILTTLALNLLFSSWSRACLRIERFYEMLMDKEGSYDAKSYGFRHLFYYITKGQQESGDSGIHGDEQNSPVKTEISDHLKTIHWFKSRAAWKDPFVFITITAGIVYLAFYVTALNVMCPSPTC